jgi:hypothetical protein
MLSPATRVILTALIESDTATAFGIVAHGSSPVLALCRKLIEAGHDPRAPLEAWRGPILALRIRSIREAARLKLNGDGTGFKPRPEGGRGSQASRLSKSDPNEGQHGNTRNPLGVACRHALNAHLLSGLKAGE